MPTYTPQQKIQISKHIMRILDEWGLNNKEIINILALPNKLRSRHLERFREGTPLPDDNNVMQRIEQITGIADALRTSFPRNAHMGVLWMRTPHKRFQNQTPLHVLVDRGLSGLRVVRAELDCSFAWDETKTD